VSTDFVDDDLVAAGGPATTRERDEPESDDDASRLARQREKLTGEVASAAQEIERLRLRQEELEQEKARLAELNARQDRYTTGKRALLDDLNQALLVMKKDQMRAERLVELLTVTRARCQEMLDELHALDEERWSESAFDEELALALALVEKSRMEYGRAMAKVEAELPAAEAKATRARGPRAGRSLAEKGVGFWFKIGLAFSLPFILALAALLAVYIYSLGGF